MDKHNVVYETLENIAAAENLENHQIQVNSLSTDGANFSSSLYKAVITSANKEELKLFVKVAGLSESLRRKFDDLTLQLETYFYKNSVPKYNELQDKYNIPLDERYVFPKYYGSNLKYLEETVVMEDLVADGYKLYERTEPIDWEYASRAVEEMAKFHALSFAYQHEYPEDAASDDPMYSLLYASMYKQMEESFMNTGNNVLAIVPDELKIRFRAFIKEFWTEESQRKYHISGKWKVLIHGDYRASNIMYKSQDGKVTKLVPVDYQTIRYGSPSLDVLYLIYSGTDEEFRRKYFERLLDLYYATISKWLRLLNMNPETVFSRKDFDEDLEDMRAFGLYIAVFVLPIILVDLKSVPHMDVSGSEVGDFTVKPTESFQKRFMPILYEYVDLGIL